MTSLLSSLFLNGDVPFKILKTHGMLVDKTGQKMSKSQGNGLNPLDLIYGTVKIDGERSHGFGSDTLRVLSA